MATYKLIQDIEAEDKILGPLTLRQFIFALISIFFLYICFILLTKGGAFFLILFLPPALFFGFFAMPFGRDQPTEIWALAKLRYYFKPRQRVWNQSGVKELVTITVPKKIEQVFTDGLSQTEVRSRLQALANTLDTRGWAVKNVDPSAYVSPLAAAGSDDRLLDISAIPQPVSDSDITDADDIMDAGANPLAQQFDNMINRSTQTHHDELVQLMNGVRQGQRQDGPQADYWFMDKEPTTGAALPARAVAPAASTPTQPTPLPGDDDSAGEAALSAQLRAKQQAPKASDNMHALRPAPQVAPPADPAILTLAHNDDLNVSTLAREAHRAKGEDDGEVVIPLH